MRSLATSVATAARLVTRLAIVLPRSRARVHPVIAPRSLSIEKVAPKEGEAQTKTVDGKLWRWCAKCGRWSTTHGTAEHRDPPKSNLALARDPSAWHCSIVDDSDISWSAYFGSWFWWLVSWLNTLQACLIFWLPLTGLCATWIPDDWYRFGLEFLLSHQEWWLPVLLWFGLFWTSIMKLPRHGRACRWIPPPPFRRRVPPLLAQLSLSSHFSSTERLRTIATSQCCICICWFP